MIGCSQKAALVRETTHHSSSMWDETSLRLVKSTWRDEASERIRRLFNPCPHIVCNSKSLLYRMRGSCNVQNTLVEGPARGMVCSRSDWLVLVSGVGTALVARSARVGIPLHLAWLYCRWCLDFLGFLLAMAGVLGLGSNLTAVPYPKDNATLVETGPFYIVRHPIYCGLILMAFGWGLWVHGWLTIGYAALLFIFFDIKSRREEQWLTEKYSGYGAYQKRVRKLIPFVY